jgi:hypothetical protein
MLPPSVPKMAIHKVVVDIAHGLQVGITDGGVEKLEPAPFHIAAYSNDPISKNI